LKLLLTAAVALLLAGAAAAARRPAGREEAALASALDGRARLMPRSALSGDFDGDGRRDVLAIVRCSGAPPRTVTLLNPFQPKNRPRAAAGSLALAVRHGDGRAYLLADRDFFATPIWNGKLDGLVSLRPRPRKGQEPRGARGDVVRVGTEAGIDVTLFWDGRTYRLFTPAETP
jgi:hypothetical protein